MNEDGKVEYTEVIQADGFNAQQLYANAKKWIGESYKSSKTITADDAAGTKLDGKAIAKCNKGGKGFGGTHYTFSIMCKDGRYKYSFTDFSHRDYDNAKNTGGKLHMESSEKLNDKDWTLVKQQTDAEMKAKVESLKKGMTAIAVKKKDDW